MLLAPFCLVMPELDAYYAYRQFLNKFIPTYVCKLITGVHQGLRLMHEWYVYICICAQVVQVIF